MITSEAEANAQTSTPSPAVPFYTTELVRLELMLFACASITAALPGPSSPSVPRYYVASRFRLLVHDHTPHDNAIGRNLEDRPVLPR